MTGDHDSLPCWRPWMPLRQRAASRASTQCADPRSRRKGKRIASAPGRTHRAAAVIALSAVTACSSEPRDNARFLGPCADPTEAIVPAAVDAFVTSIDPKPRRFLIASGTDSALPAGSESRLQKHGPTYVYPPDTALRRRVLARLDSTAIAYGSVPTLLVTFRGIDRAGEHRALVRLGGYFIGGRTDGAVVHRTIQFVCDTARWHLGRTVEERQS